MSEFITPGLGEHVTVTPIAQHEDPYTVAINAMVEILQGTRDIVATLPEVIHEGLNLVRSNAAFICNTLEANIAALVAKKG